MKSIRGRLTASVLAVCALALVAVGFLVERSLHSRLVQEFDERLRVVALAITTVTKQEREFIDIAFTDRYIREFDDEDPRKFFQFWSPLPFHHDRGNRIERSDSLEGGDLPRNTGTLDAPEFWNFQLPDGRPGRAIGIRYVPHADAYDRRRNFNPRLNLDLVVAEDRTELDQAVATLRGHILPVGIGGLALVLIAVPLVLWRGLRPLEELTRRTRQVTATNLGCRFATEGLPRELRPIAAGLNSLLERLEESFKRERRFSADLAHELRTPIAELRSLAETHITFPENNGQELAQDAREIALQMQSLVVKLLWLYRSEHGQLPVNPEPLDARELIDELWSPRRETAERKRIAFTSDIQPDSGLSTDRTLFTSILRNLLDNAAEYTPLDGAIHVEYREADRRFQLTVSNTTDMPDPTECRNMFDRFWRGDRARVSGQHAGLGLAIVQSFCDLLKYDVRADLPETSRLTVRIEGGTEAQPSATAGSP